MTDEEYVRIKKTLDRSPILLADAEKGDVRLITEAEAFTEMLNRPGAVLLANAKRALMKFIEQQGTGTADEAFRREDLATVAGVSFETVYSWIREGVLRPSVRPSSRGRGRGPLYSRGDLFVAGLIGMARRQGMPLSVLAQMQPLFLEKRTARKKQPAERS